MNGERVAVEVDLEEPERGCGPFFTPARAKGDLDGVAQRIPRLPHEEITLLDRTVPGREDHCSVLSYPNPPRIPQPD